MDQARVILLGLAGILLVFSILLVLPFLQFFLLAVLLAFLLRPLQRRLEDRTSSRIAASILVAAATVAVILPLVFVVRRTASEASAILTRIREGEMTLGGLEQRIEELTGVDVPIAEMLRAAAQDVGTGAFDSVLSVFGTVTHLVVGVGLTLFLLYYFLKDDDKFISWTRQTIPGSSDVVGELYDEIADIMWAVLAGHVLVAIIQGAIAGVGLVAVGIPNAIFWTVVMIVLAVLPVIGSFLVWGPASLYLVTVNRPLAGVALFVYGTVVVGLSDDYLRPIIVDRYARLSPSVIIIGILGGIYLFGFMGIFYGPILIGSLRATLDVYREEYVRDSVDQKPDEEDPDEEAVKEAALADQESVDEEIGDEEGGDEVPS